MEECLRETGPSWGERLRDRGLSSDLPDSVAVIVCSEDPPPSARIWPVGLQRFLLLLHADGTCSVEAKTESPSALSEWMQQFGMTASELEVHAGRISLRSADLLPRDGGDDAKRLSLWRLFGFRTFI